MNWRDEESSRILIEYLDILSEYLRSLSPGKAVAVSGFSNAVMSPQDLRIFWQGILRGTAIDTVFFQDGIGVHKLDLDNLPKYLEALRWACSKESRQLEVVVEVFSQTAGVPVSDGIFAAIPAPLSRIKDQLMIAKRYSSKVIAFSVPEYMTPLGGSQAENLFNEYRKNMGSQKNSLNNF